MTDKELTNLQINEENYIGSEFNVFSTESTGGQSIFEGYKRDNNIKKEAQQTLTHSDTNVTNVANETVSGGTTATSTTVTSTSAVGGSTITTITTTVVVAAGGAGIGVVALGVSFAAFNARINNFKYNLDNENIILHYDFEIGYNVKGLLHVALNDDNGFEVVQDYEVLEEKNEELTVEGYTYASYISGQFLNNETTNIIYDKEYHLSVYSIVNQEKRFYYQSEEPIVFKHEEPIGPIYDSPSFIGEVVTKKDPNRLIGTTNAVIYVEDNPEEEENSLIITMKKKGLEDVSYEQYFSFNRREQDMSNPGVPMQDGYKYEVGLLFDAVEVDVEYEITYTFESYRYGEGEASGGSGELFTTVMHQEDFIIKQEEITELMPYVGLNYYLINYNEGENDELVVSYTHHDNGVIYDRYLINILDMDNTVLISQELEELRDQEMYRINLELLTKGNGYTVEVIGEKDTTNNTLIKHAIYY